MMQKETFTPFRRSNTSMKIHRYASIIEVVLSLRTKFQCPISNNINSMNSQLDHTILYEYSIQVGSSETYTEFEVTSEFLLDTFSLYGRHSFINTLYKTSSSLSVAFNFAL